MTKCFHWFPIKWLSLLIVIDSYLRYSKNKIVKSTAPSTVIPKLHTIFSSFDLPQIAKKDVMLTNEVFCSRISSCSRSSVSHLFDLL